MDDIRIIDNRKIEFFQCYNVIIDDERTDSYDISVYVTLVRYANNNPEGKCWPSYAHLMKHLGFKRTKLVETINKLEELKYIRKSKRQNNSNMYYLNDLSIIIEGMSSHDSPLSNIEESRETNGVVRQTNGVVRETYSINNNKQITSKKEKTEITKVISAEQSSVKQSTLIPLKQTATVKPKKLTRSEQMAQKVVSALQGGSWDKITHTHLVNYYVQRHAEVLGITIPYNYNNHPPQFKEGFMQRYFLNAEQTAHVIDTFLEIFSERRKVENGGYDRVNLTQLTSNQQWVNNIMEQTFKRLKRQAESSQRVEKKEPVEISENDIF